MAPKHELHDGSESSRPIKYRMGSDSLPVSVTNTNTVLAPGSSVEVETGTIMKRASLVLVVEGIPIEYKGARITLAEAEELRRKDPEYCKELIKHNYSTGLLRDAVALSMVMKLVVIPDTPLLFDQVAHRSNKFLWTERQGIAVPELEAPKLSRLCQGFYISICHGYLLYLYAKFKMPSKSSFDKLTFLPAITPDRREMIRYLSCPWDIKTTGSAGKMFTLITSLKLLKTLELRLDVDAADTFQRSKNNDLTKIGGFNNLALLLQVREVKLDIVVDDPATTSNEAFSQRDASEILREEILEALKTYTTKKCNTSEACIQARFDRLALKADLDVHGSGRLGFYRKENDVSTHTRSAIHLGVDHLGRAIKRTPKSEYADEKLSWTGVTVLKSQMLKSDHHDYIRQGCNVQFQVCHDKDKVTSWENAMALTSVYCRDAIIRYYKEELRKGTENTQRVNQVILLWRNVLEHRYEYKKEDFPDPADVKKGIEQQNHWESLESSFYMTCDIRALEYVLSAHITFVANEAARHEQEQEERHHVDTAAEVDNAQR